MEETTSVPFRKTYNTQGKELKHRVAGSVKLKGRQRHTGHLAGALRGEASCCCAQRWKPLCSPHSKRDHWTGKRSKTEHVLAPPLR